MLPSGIPQWYGNVCSETSNCKIYIRFMKQNDAPKLNGNSKHYALFECRSLKYLGIVSSTVERAGLKAKEIERFSFTLKRHTLSRQR